MIIYVYVRVCVYVCVANNQAVGVAPTSCVAKVGFSPSIYKRGARKSGSPHSLTGIDPLSGSKLLRPVVFVASSPKVSSFLALSKHCARKLTFPALFVGKRGASASPSLSFRRAAVKDVAAVSRPH